MRIVLAVIAALLLLASPVQAAVSAAGQLSGDGTVYRLSVTNTGDETINCIRYTTPGGEFVLTVRGPGNPTGAGPGFTAGNDLGIAPGGKAEWTLSLDKPVPDQRGGTLAVSAKCILGSDTESGVAGPGGADLAVELYTSASYDPPPEGDNPSAVKVELGDKVTVVQYVLIRNRGPRTSRGGSFTYTFPPRSERVRGDRPLKPGDPPPPERVTISVGPIAAGAQRQAGMLIYRVRPGSGRHLSTVELTGIDDPTTPDRDRALTEFNLPASTFPGAGTSGATLRPNLDFQLKGKATSGRGPGSPIGRRARAAATLPPRYDADKAASLRRVEVAILRLAPTGSERALAPACQWLRSPRGGFKRIAPRRGRCDRAVWLRAAGIGSWTFRVPNGLPAGRYVAYTRAVNALGVSDGSFSAKKRNRLVLVVR